MPEQWEEIDRKFLGVNFTEADPKKKSDLGGYYAVYNVAKRNPLTGEYRNGIETGPVVRYYGEGFLAFKSLFSAYAGVAMNPGVLEDGRVVEAPAPQSFWKPKSNAGRKPKDRKNDWPLKGSDEYEGVANEIEKKLEMSDDDLFATIGSEEAED
jgi:hypothetical protein